MKRLMPTFCGIDIDSNNVLTGSLIEEHNPGYSGPSLLDCGDCIAIPASQTFEILESNGDSSFDSGYVYANTIATHMFDMPEGCFVSLNEKGLCGSIYAERDQSGCILYALTYHDGGIKSRIIYSSMHKKGYTNNLKNYTTHTATELHGLTFLGQYTGEESIKSVLSAIGAKE
ncbi:MAG: hypothetical protein PHT07_10290 [Paludibacter sp.]|nr:hypothetical protein [Paludibacter sp.]